MKRPPAREGRCGAKGGRKCPSLDSVPEKASAAIFPGIAADGSKRLVTLAAQSEGLQNRVVAVDAFALQIVEELAATAGHGEKAAAAVEILAVIAQMFREVGDALGEQRDLDLGGAGILLVGPELGDDFLFNSDFRHVGWL